MRARQSALVSLTKMGPAGSSEEAELVKAKVAATANAEADPSVGYAAEHAALAFGIPRVAPVPIATGEPPGRLREPAGAPQRAADERVFGAARYLREDASSASSLTGPLLAAEPSGFALEDLTESLTADADGAAAVAARAGPTEPAEPAGAGAGSASDQVTTMLTVPKGRGLQAPQDFAAESSSLTQRSIAPLDELLGESLGESLSESLSEPLGGELRGLAAAPLKTIAMPLLQGPMESATTTWTLPPATGPAAATLGRGALGRSARLVAVALVGAALGACVSLLTLRALPSASVGPGSGRRVAPRRPDANAERLIEQAVTALRAGQGEHAAALLRRYKDGRPAAEPEPAVEIMLRVLHRDAAAGPAR